MSCCRKPSSPLHSVLTRRPLAATCCRMVRLRRSINAVWICQPHTPSMWPQLSSPSERFFISIIPRIVLNILYSAYTNNVHQRAGFSLPAPLSHAGPVPLLGRLLTDSCACGVPLAGRALHGRWAAGFVMRGGFAPWGVLTFREQTSEGGRRTLLLR